MGWLLHVLGVDDLSGRWYGFWSGFGSDIGELGIVVGLAALVRKHNCHVKGCPRIGRYPVTGTDWVVCRKHNPETAPDAARVREKHHLYLGKQPGRG